MKACAGDVSGGVKQCGPGAGTGASDANIGDWYPGAGPCIGGTGIPAQKKELKHWHADDPRAQITRAHACALHEHDERLKHSLHGHWLSLWNPRLRFINVSVWKPARDAQLTNTQAITRRHHSR